MNISEAAKKAELPVKTVRYYADIGLVAESGRSDAGYRAYDDSTLRRLVFVRKARAIGFSIDECRELIGLYQDSGRSSADVKRLAGHRLQEIEAKQRELASLHHELSRLIASCRGDERADCPIMDFLG